MSEPVDLVEPVAVPVGPPVPSAAVPEEEFDPAYEAFNGWERDTLRPGMNALAAGTFVNAGQARIAASGAAASESVALAAREDAVDAALTALNAPGTLATSTTELTIEVGEPNLVIQPGKSLRPGMYVTCSAPGGQLMYGRILNYDTVTGALELFVLLVEGAGTFSEWAVAVSGPPARIPRNKLYYYGGA